MEREHSRHMHLLSRAIRPHPRHMAHRPSRAMRPHSSMDRQLHSHHTCRHLTHLRRSTEHHPSTAICLHLHSHHTSHHRPHTNIRPRPSPIPLPRFTPQTLPTPTRLPLLPP